MNQNFTVYQYIQSYQKNLTEKQLQTVLDLKAQGFLPSYIAKYERTGLAPHMLSEIFDLLDEFNLFSEKKKLFLERLEKQKEKDLDLETKLIEAKTLEELEELFSHIKKRSSNKKVSKAFSAGLDKLAQWILKEAQDKSSKEDLSLEVKAKEYQNIEKGFATYEEVLKGAQLILSHKAVCDKKLREDLKRRLFEEAEIFISEGEKKKPVKNSLIGVQESLKNLSQFKNISRFFQIMRGLKQKELKISLKYKDERLLPLVRNFFEIQEESKATAFLNFTAKTTFQTHLIPSLESEIYEEIWNRGEKKILEIFSFYVKKMFLRNGLGKEAVLSLFCDEKTKVLCLIGPQGDLLSHTPIDLEKMDELKTLVKSIEDKLSIKALVLNRQAQKHYKMIKESFPSLPIAILPENHARALLKQKSLKLEPHYIAHQLALEIQNPFLQLSQLSCETGFQAPFHQISSEKLNRIFIKRFQEILSLKPLDINHVSEDILKKSGLTKEEAQKVIEKRPFKNLKDLSPILEDPHYKQTHCFFKLEQSDNILDKTDLHPRHLAAVSDMLKSLKQKPENLFEPIFQEKLDLEKEKWIQILGKDDFFEIINTLKKFPESQKSKPLKFHAFSDSLNDFSDLKNEELYWGQVHSVASFGFFIDLGLEANGFIPFHEVKEKGIKNVLSFLSPGDWLQVKLKTKNEDKNQVSLSLHLPTPAPRASTHSKPAPKKFQRSKGKPAKHPSSKTNKTAYKKPSSSFHNPFEELQKLKSKLSR